MTTGSPPRSAIRSSVISARSSRCSAQPAPRDRRFSTDRERRVGVNPDRLGYRAWAAVAAMRSSGELATVKKGSDETKKVGVRSTGVPSTPTALGRLRVGTGRRTQPRNEPRRRSGVGSESPSNGGARACSSSSSTEVYLDSRKLGDGSWKRLLTPLPRSLGTPRMRAIRRSPCRLPHARLCRLPCAKSDRSPLKS